MPVQTTYQSNIDAARAGERANTIPATTISRTVETAAGIGFGKAVAQGTNDKGIVLFAGSATILGITMRERSLDANNPDEFSQYDEARVMTKGAIYVEVGATVSAGDSVYVTDAGVFTSASSGNTQITGARFETGATSGNLAEVRLT